MTSFPRYSRAIAPTISASTLLVVVFLLHWHDGDGAAQIIFLKLTIIPLFLLANSALAKHFRLALADRGWTSMLVAYAAQGIVFACSMSALMWQPETNIWRLVDSFLFMAIGFGGGMALIFVSISALISRGIRGK